MNIIITGNIGCGKSTIVQRLKELLVGYEFHDVDQLVRDWYATPEAEAFLMATCGTTDRSVISDMAFANPALRKSLEERTMRDLHEKVIELFALPNAIIEFPLYFEMGCHINRHDRHQRVITVACPEETQIRRVKERNGFTDEKIAKIRAIQYPASVKESLADYVINNPDFADVKPQLEELINLWGI